MASVVTFPPASPTPNAPVGGNGVAAVVNAQLAPAPSNTVKGNNLTTSFAPQDIPYSTLAAALQSYAPNFIGDSGAGGVKGLVPAPTAGATAAYAFLSADGSFKVVSKTAVGLSNVDNTSDASKPVSTAQATAIGLKLDAAQKAAANGVAPLDSSSKVPSANLPTTDSITEGTGNLYFTNPRALSAVSAIAPSASSGDVGKDASYRAGATILIPPARYKMADYLAGGVPSGVAATDTTAYNACLANIIAAGGNRILELPAGTIKLTNGIQLDANNVNGMAVVGAGRQRTFLAAQSTTGNDIVLGNTALALGNFKLDGFSILPSATKTAGSAVLINDAQKIEINIEILGGFRGIQYENAGDQAVSYVEDPYITGLSEDAFVIGLAQSLLANGLWINSGIVGQCRSAMRILRASGVHVHGLESYQATGDAYVFEPTGIGIQGLWFSDALADSATGVGYHFKSSGAGPVAEIYMTSCQSGSCVARGWEVDSGTNLNGLYITDPLCVNTNNTGMRFVAGKQIHISGGQVSYSNGIGISMENGLTEWSVKGVHSGHLGWFAANGIAARQTTGLYIGTTNNYYEIGGNWYVRNTSVGLNNNSTGAANKIIGTDFTI